ncbi:SMI1/KNR4 family protein [Saccharothrix sp. S26]|nr:SMI1/KNR4 family protein [Saccharothrix sp. S26]
MGTPLPADYKEFMRRFPSGMFRDVVCVFNPVQDEESLARLVDEFEGMLLGVRILWEEYDDDSFPPFPEPRGVIPFASDSSGGSLFWLPWHPDPDRWHVVFLSRNLAAGWTRTRRPMTAVMRQLANSRSERNILGWDLAGKERDFEPF